MDVGKSEVSHDNNYQLDKLDRKVLPLIAAGDRLHTYSVRQGSFLGHET